MYFGAGCLLWWPVQDEPWRLRPGRRAGYLFAAFLLASPLGLLLALIPEPLYEWYEDGPGLWGFSAITDQQIAGVTMLEQAVVFFAASRISSCAHSAVTSGARSLETLLVRRVPAGDGHARPLVEPGRPGLVLGVDLQADSCVPTLPERPERRAQERVSEPVLALRAADCEVEHPPQVALAERERRADDRPVGDRRQSTGL